MNVLSLPEKIKQFRKSTGMNQKELADKLGVTSKAVSAWERGIATPRPAMVEQLADAFGIQPYELYIPAAKGQMTFTDMLNIEPALPDTHPPTQSESDELGIIKNRIELINEIIESFRLSETDRLLRSVLNNIKYLSDGDLVYADRMLKGLKRYDENDF